MDEESVSRDINSFLTLCRDLCGAVSNSLNQGSRLERWQCTSFMFGSFSSSIKGRSCVVPPLVWFQTTKTIRRFLPKRMWNPNSKSSPSCVSVENCSFSKRFFLFTLSSPIPPIPSMLHSTASSTLELRSHKINFCSVAGKKLSFHLFVCAVLCFSHWKRNATFRLIQFLYRFCFSSFMKNLLNDICRGSRVRVVCLSYFILKERAEKFWSSACESRQKEAAKNRVYYLLLWQAEAYTNGKLSRYRPSID